MSHFGTLLTIPGLSSPEEWLCVRPRAYSLSGASEKSFTWVGIGLTRIQTRLERPARKQHSSLFCQLVSYEESVVNMTRTTTLHFLLNLWI